MHKLMHFNAVHHACMHWTSFRFVHLHHGDASVCLCLMVSQALQQSGGRLAAICTLFNWLMDLQPSEGGSYQVADEAHKQWKCACSILRCHLKRFA